MKPDAGAWVARYSKETGEQFRLPPGYNLWATHEYGFIMWKIVGSDLWLNQCCVESSWWWPRVAALAKQHKCTMIRAVTKHNPKVFARLFGGTYEGSIAEFNFFRKEVGA